MFIARRL
jgi:chromate transport protein ChrA